MIIKRNQPIAAGRIQSGGDIDAPPVEDAFIYDTVDALERIAKENGKSIPQVAINWLSQNETVSNIIIGVRNEKQLLDNLDAVGWSLSAVELAELTL